LDEHDRREGRRFDLFASLHGEVTVTRPVEIRDLSARGMRVATSLALNLNAHYEFRLTIGDRAAVVTGRVAHTRPSQNEKGVTVYLSGIEFVEVSEVSQSIINRFLEITHLAEAKLRAHARAQEGSPERRSD
jgi:PilZ domain